MKIATAKMKYSLEPAFFNILLVIWSGDTIDTSDAQRAACADDHFHAIQSIAIEQNFCWLTVRANGRHKRSFLLLLVTCDIFQPTSSLNVRWNAELGRSNLDQLDSSRIGLRIL